MKDYSCTAERFAGDVASHQLTVVRAEGVNRHLRFRRPGSSTYWFDILTWPGALCIDGDCGTYVFRRLEDMFEFFLAGGSRINPAYWSEKCVSARKELIKEFDWSSFEVAAREHLNRWAENHPADAVEEVRRDFEDSLHSTEPDEFGAVSFIRDFESGSFHFVDFESDCNEYTFHFIWCLRAICWGIQKFSEAVMAEGSAA